MGTVPMQDKEKKKEEKKAAKEAEKAAKAAKQAELVRAELSSEDVPCSCRSACKHGTHSFLLQAAQRGQKQAVMTQAEEDDPVKDKYGDAPMVQSREVASRPYTDIGTLDASCADKEVCDLSILKARKQVITCTFSLTITGNPVCELLSLRESIVHTHTHARTHTHTHLHIALIRPALLFLPTPCVTHCVTGALQSPSTQCAWQGQVLLCRAAPPNSHHSGQHLDDAVSPFHLATYSQLQLPANVHQQ